MSNESIELKAVAITEDIYRRYGTNTGILFGIPVNCKIAVKAIVKLTIEELVGE